MIEDTYVALVTSLILLTAARSQDPIPHLIPSFLSQAPVSHLSTYFPSQDHVSHLITTLYRSLDLNSGVYYLSSF
jgi:hypothetical protein